MAIKDLFSSGKPVSPAHPDTHQPNGERDSFFYEIKHKIHNRFVEEANLAALDDLDQTEAKTEIGKIVDYFLREEQLLLNEEEHNALILEILDELTGLGPIEPFFNGSITQKKVVTYSVA